MASTSAQRQTLTVNVLLWLSALNCRAPLVATGPLLPVIIPALRLSPAVAGLLTALPLLMMGVWSLPGGSLGDRVGPHRMLVVGLLAVVAGGAARALAHNVVEFLVAVAVLGAAIGATQPILAQLARLAGRERAAATTAVYSSGILLGALVSALGSVPLLHLIGAWSWRGVFLAWAALGLVAALGWLVVPPPIQHTEPPVPLPGNVRRTLPGIAQFATIFALQSAAFYAMATWLPEYYTTQGWSLFFASVPLTAVMAASVPAGVCAPWLLRRLGGFRLPLLLTGLAAALGLAGFVLVPDLGVVWGTVVGFSASAAFTICMAAPPVLAPAGATGRMAGVLLAIGYGGAVAGPVLLGLLRGETGSLQAGLWALVGMGLLWALTATTLPSGMGNDGQIVPAEQKGSPVA